MGLSSHPQHREQRKRGPIEIAEPHSTPLKLTLRSMRKTDGDIPAALMEHGACAQRIRRAIHQS